MLRLRDGIVELYRKALSTVPTDVEEALKKARNDERDPEARDFVSSIIDGIRSMRQQSMPLCVDMGIPTFVVKSPRGLSQTEIAKTIGEATAIATEKIPIKPCAVDIISEEVSASNTGQGFPIIYFEESPNDTLRIDLLLKGADCEVLGRTYLLPDEETGAERDLEGVKKVVLDAIKRSEGKGCMPFVIGVGIGGSKDQVSVLSKMQLFRKLGDRNEIPAIAMLEEETLVEANNLGLSWMKGNSSILGIKIGVNHRHISSYLVDVSFSCWATRRVRLIW
ncbi:MAG: fumarate hydratase [Thermodesulfovibrionales bacterium]